MYLKSVMTEPRLQRYIIDGARDLLDIRLPWWAKAAHMAGPVE